MKKILVAIDYSDASRNAADYAVALAKEFGADVVLVNAVYIPMPVGDAPGYIPLSLSEVQQENEALLQTETENLSKRHGFPVRGTAATGSAAGVIKDTAAEIDADLVIMGMKGSGGSSSIFGSTVTECIRILKMPLLIVPESKHCQPLKHISFAADFDNMPEAKRLHLLEDIAAKYQSEIKVVHVQKTEDDMPADKVAGKMEAHLLFEKMNCSYHTMLAEDVTVGLNDFMNANTTDLLVMIAHRHNLWHRIFGTSHTKIISYQNRVPLLVFHD